MDNFITVKVIRIPGGVQEVALAPGSSVGDALSAANIETTSSESIKIGTNTVDESSAVSDGDRVVISQGAKGN